MDVLGPVPHMALTPATNLPMTPGPANIVGSPKSIEGVAKGFESMFLSTLLKQMRETLEPGTLFGDDKGDILGGLFDQFLGEHLSQAGALGIAALVRQQLSAIQTSHEPNLPPQAYVAAKRSANSIVP